MYVLNIWVVEWADLVPSAFDACPPLIYIFDRSSQRIGRFFLSEIHFSLLLPRFLVPLSLLSLHVYRVESPFVFFFFIPPAFSTSQVKTFEILTNPPHAPRSSSSSHRFYHIPFLIFATLSIFLVHAPFSPKLLSFQKYSISLIWGRIPCSNFYWRADIYVYPHPILGDVDVFSFFLFCFRVGWPANVLMYWRWKSAGSDWLLHFTRTPTIDQLESRGGNLYTSVMREIESRPLPLLGAFWQTGCFYFFKLKKWGFYTFYYAFLYHQNLSYDLTCSPLHSSILCSTLLCSPLFYFTLLH